ncbi:hypothetical protein SUGI_0661300 [Cryptomeria japonica]|nr:hypothetical protein SUGI_0661300 [Cryptomeria japonica]
MVAAYAFPGFGCPYAFFSSFSLVTLWRWDSSGPFIYKMFWFDSYLIALSRMEVLFQPNRSVVFGMVAFR